MKIHIFVSRNHGFSFVWVIMLMVLLSILGMALLSVSFAETQHAARSEKQLQTNYIARSGAEAGFKKISILDSQEDIEAFVQSANSLTGLKDNVLGNGEYDISYVVDESGYYIAIVADAVHSQDSAITSRVTLFVQSMIERLDNSGQWTECPKTWRRAANLWNDVNPNVNSELDYTGHAVVITGTPTKSPQNSINESIFRANVLVFRGQDNSGVTFMQQVNTNDISLDAEVIIFEGNVQLRDGSASVFLTCSEDVLGGTLSPWTYHSIVGFEDRDRYFDFIDADDPGEEDEDHPYNTYEFDLSENYGVMLLEGNAKDRYENMILSSGVYYYRNGADLNNLVEDDLIKAASDDPIIDEIYKKYGVPYIKSSINKYFYTDDME
ncbi:type IV pilus modification PilV family protein [Anaerotalea alkaliphila]|uniref:Type 4 fimbrial biogenesis protein PilX N-terminal domain-containing protein n=1 Tax=Anaerotalea alkaliphila TaxID=2662126 RepID=A0A7X5KNP3_9FIRM|nr:hypothetical protein [Anaerotalea alkaliphila]NDL68234.1 hypothetical protein [Anaerotalea alkaliphila]